MLSSIRVMLQRATGLDLPDAAVAAAVKRRMRLCAITDTDAYAAQAMANEDELNELIDLVVVPETWFFRDAEAFSALLDFVQRQRYVRQRPIRILSIPCATGEEPYSIAMALTDAGMMPDEFQIDAIDVSRQVIERARQGIYNKNAFRSRDLSFRDRHFDRKDNDYELHENIRQMVRFRRENLLALDGTIATVAYDIIFCRNLLIYFDAPTKMLAIKKLHALLRDDGLLFSGYAEASTFSQHGFMIAPYAKAFALAKKDKTQPRPISSRLGRKTLGPHVIGTPVATHKMASALPQLVMKTWAQPSGEAIQKTPNQQLQHLLTQAKDHADKGNISDACECYLAYLRDVPDSADAYFMLGVLSEKRQDIQTAERYLRRAVYLNPEHYEALCHLVLLAEQHGNAEGAASFRQRAARVFHRISQKRSAES